MRILDRMRTQHCVYWQRAGVDAYGQPNQFAAPVELRVQWRDSFESKVDGRGEQFTTRAKVYTGQDVTPDGVLWFGRLADVPHPTAPLRNPGAAEIRRFEKVPTVRGDDFKRVAYL